MASTHDPIVGADDHESFRDRQLADPIIAAEYHDYQMRAELVNALKRLRAGKNITQRNMASVMSTTQSAISDLEKGDTDARLSTYQRYARAIGVRLHFELKEDGHDGEYSISVVHFTSSPVSGRRVKYPDVSGEIQMRKLNVETETIRETRADGKAKRLLPRTSWMPAESRVVRTQLAPVRIGKPNDVIAGARAKRG